MTADFFNTALDFCILIPCYNDEPGLIQSLKSIQYDARKFAVVVVDDGSQSAVNMGFLKSSLPHLLYLHLIRLPQNCGIITALNTGMEWILENTTARYIARLDCRDTCDAQRFYKQVSFLNARAEVGLLGSWCTFKEESTGAGYTYTTPLRHDEIIKDMHLRNVFIHPTVMFRTALLTNTGLYPYGYPHAEDYAFFWRLLQVAEGAMLGQSLTHCAIMQQGISMSNRRVQLQSRKKVIRQFGNYAILKFFGIIKLNILIIMPNTLLLRLKMRMAKGQS
jgi:glycosyltransferase involved in cell wall biosynthesis